jgi:poly-gamma-glutamate capsule biosynthesis protein CapA/YwtB (metallophosphatase superfamily)
VPGPRPSRQQARAVVTAARRTGPAAVLLAAFVVGALLLGTGQHRPITTAGQPAAPVAAEETTTTVAPAGAAGPEITLALAGDTYFQGPLADRLAADPGVALAAVEPVLAAADLALVNLETAVGEGGRPEPKQYTFRAPPSALTALRAAGIDAASMANNHALDYGPDSLGETLEAERATGFPLIGIGADEDEAYAPFTTDVRGRRVSVVAATQVLDKSLVGSWTATGAQGGVASARRVDRLAQAVRTAAAQSDTVVVFLHWGVEEQSCPTADQRQLALAVVEAGADVVVGSHAHRLLGGGFLGDAYVHYGLGNFAFHPRDAEASRTGVLELRVGDEGVTGARWRPGRIDGGTRLPRLLEGGDAAAELAHWEGLRACAGLRA